MLGGCGRLVLGVDPCAWFADKSHVDLDLAQEPPVPGCQPPAADYLDHVLVKSRHLNDRACIVPPQFFVAVFVLN